MFLLPDAPRHKRVSASALIQYVKAKKHKRFENKPQLREQLRCNMITLAVTLLVLVLTNSQNAWQPASKKENTNYYLSEQNCFEELLNSDISSLSICTLFYFTYLVHYFTISARKSLYVRDWCKFPYCNPFYYILSLRISFILSLRISFCIILLYASLALSLSTMSSAESSQQGSACTAFRPDEKLCTKNTICSKSLLMESS